MNAKKYLSQFQRINQEINSDLAEIYRLMALASNISVAQKEINIQSSSSQDKLGDAVSKIVDIENEILQKIEKMREMRNVIEIQIKDLDNEMEYFILNEKYIKNWTFEKIADEHSYSVRHVIRIYNKALKNFEEKYNIK